MTEMILIVLTVEMSGGCDGNSEEAVNSFTNALQ